MITLKSLKQYLSESNEPHVILNKHTLETDSEWPSKEEACRHLIDTMRFHHKYTVLSKADVESGNHPYRKGNQVYTSESVGKRHIHDTFDSENKSANEHPDVFGWKKRAIAHGHTIIRGNSVGDFKAYDKFGTVKGKFSSSSGKQWLEEDTLPESKMSDLHIILQDHLDHHIKAYKEGKTGPDTFGNRVVNAHAKIARDAGIAHEHAAKFANEYVDSKLQ